jgi:hypothetical protein
MGSTGFHFSVHTGAGIKKTTTNIVVVLPTLESVWIADGLSTNGLTTIQWRQRATATPQPAKSVFV